MNIAFHVQTCASSRVFAGSEAFTFQAYTALGGCLARSVLT